MKHNNIFQYTIILGLTATSMVSCVSSGDNPGIEYAPDMYRSQAYEPFTQEQKFDYNPNGMTMRLPVRGTVARGQATFIYPHPNTGDGYAASASYTAWVAPTKTNVAEGERLYGVFCTNCHGKNGKNDGSIFKSKKIPAPSWPNYQSDYIKELPLGKAYHTIVYGKGLMGSHAFMLDPEERWKVLHYVKSLAFGDDFEYAPENSSEDILEDNAAYLEKKTKSQPETVSYSKFPVSAADQEMEVTAISKVDFNAFSSKKVMKGNSESQLNKIADYMKAHPTFKASIVGNTDATISKERAAILSKNRANNVISYLIRKGVPAANLNATSVVINGMSEDITSSEVRHSNRRVKIEIYI